jgi:hypothetical protein
MGVIGNVADAQGLLVACAGGILDDDCVDQAAQIAVGQNLGAVHPFAGGVWNMVSGLLGC